MDARLKPIKIKTGVVKRYGTEKNYYKKEAIKEAEKIEKYRQEGKDEHDIRKQEEVAKESEMMIPDCKRRLEQSLGELEALLQKEADLAEEEIYKAAQKQIEEAKKILEED